ncbi:MAG: RHS repeat-associated core domain-containing protein [Candidatus Omnitrophica bacterium]|nr:RHS repeat-associated core domain-containing protein [Candidatus Omnitrophota bacterium]
MSLSECQRIEGYVITYDDFGNLATNSTETIANPFKYVGKYGVMTDVNDLLYMRARYYVPSVGRFTQYGPIGALNPYIYVENNPINGIDPLGEQSYAETVVMSAVMVAAIALMIAQINKKAPKTYTLDAREELRRWCNAPKPPRDPCAIAGIACVLAVKKGHFGAAILHCAAMAIVCGMRIFFR